MNALQAIRHVRFSEIWNKVQVPEQFLTDLNEELPAVSSFSATGRGARRTPGSGTSVCDGQNLDD